MTPLSRRNWLAWGTAGLAVTLAPAAWAGSYLDRAALLVHEGSISASFLRKRLYDKESAQLVHELARARVTSANRMQVPEEVIQAHPHLLLMLEKYERAASAAVDGRPNDFLVLRNKALDEEDVFRTILKHLGWALPKLKT